MARGCDVGGFYSLRYTDIARTRKRITEHSRALPFFGPRLARRALACASAVVERAGIARAYSEKKVFLIAGIREANADGQ